MESMSCSAKLYDSVLGPQVGKPFDKQSVLPHCPCNAHGKLCCDPVTLRDGCSVVCSLRTLVYIRLSHANVHCPLWTQQLPVFRQRQARSGGIYLCVRLLDAICGLHISAYVIHGCCFLVAVSLDPSCRYGCMHALPLQCNCVRRLSACACAAAAISSHFPARSTCTASRTPLQGRGDISMRGRART